MESPAVRSKVRPVVPARCAGGFIPEAMSAYNPRADKPDDGSIADQDTCDDCAELPNGWPCATCYIVGEKTIQGDSADE